MKNSFLSLANIQITAPKLLLSIDSSLISNIYLIYISYANEFQLISNNLQKPSSHPSDRISISL